MGVSLDDNKGKAAWLKAIEQDGLPWIHVADLKCWSNEAAVLYGVRGIPQNYLIDPTRTIIAVNLRGDKVEEEMVKIFALLVHINTEAPEPIVLGASVLWM